MDWARASLPKSPRWHYRLVRTPDVAKHVVYVYLGLLDLFFFQCSLDPYWRALVHRERDRIGYQQFQILPYGDNFPDLAHFLNTLPHSRTCCPTSLAIDLCGTSPNAHYPPLSRHFHSTRPPGSQSHSEALHALSLVRGHVGMNPSLWKPIRLPVCDSARENDAATVQRILEESPTDPTYVLRSRTTAETPLHVRIPRSHSLCLIVRGN